MASDGSGLQVVEPKERLTRREITGETLGPVVFAVLGFLPDAPEAGR